jgi:beta-lactamase regulating signal transducer with metallopeptidase domain
MQLFTQSALLKALGWALFNSLWQMGLLWLFYRFFIVVFRNSSSHVRHNLAVALLGFGAIGSGVEFIAGYFFAGTGVSTGAAPWPGGWLLTEGQPGHFWQTGRLYISEVLPYCSSLYLLILGVFLARYSNHYFYSRRLKYGGLSKMQPELRVFADMMSRRMGIRKPVQAWLSSLVDTPLTLGFFKPVILLPVAMANNLTLQQTEAILLHELAHIRRNDYLLNLGVTVLELLFFFNPFARMLINEVKREREHRCDDWVLQFRYDPHAYVSALLSLAAHFPQQPSLTLAAIGGGNNRLLLQRARRILQQKNAADRPGVRPVMLLLLTLAVAMIGNSLQKPLSATVTKIRISSPRGTFLLAVRPDPATAYVPPPGPGLFHPPARRSVAQESVSVRIVNIAPVPAPDPKKNKLIARITTVRVIARRPGPAMTSAPDDNDLAYEEVEGNNDIMTAGSDLDAPATETYATTMLPPDSREYSFGNGPAAATAILAPDSRKLKGEHLPYVPNSSFSFQYTDSTHPAERLAWLQLYSRQEFTTAVKKLQQDLALSLQALQLKQGGDVPQNPRTRLQIENQQLKLQQQYILKLTELQKKLERTDRRLRIVYI